MYGLRVRVRVQVKEEGVRPTISHSIIYSGVGEIATFSHLQPCVWEDAQQEQPFSRSSVSSPCTVRLLYRCLVETEIVPPLTLTNQNYH